MANNIRAINDDIERHRIEAEGEAAENFGHEMVLTPEEKATLAAMENEEQVMVTETGPDGRRVEQTMKEYAAPLDDRIKSIGRVSDDTERLIKFVNSGDIQQSLEQAKAEGRERAIKAFRSMSISSGYLDDDDIIAINDEAIEAIRVYLKMDRLDSDRITKDLNRLSMSQLAEILPKRFMEIYSTPAEIRANNSKAKERLVSAIAYLTVTGPEMDYLNEYIEKEHRLMNVSKRLMDCRMSLLEAIKSPEKISEIAAKATTISEPDHGYLSKYVVSDPKRVHNEYAQNVVVHQEYKDAYLKLREEYLDEPESLELIDEQIEECDAKIKVYQSVYELDTMKKLWATMSDRLTKSNRGGWKNLEREAVEAINRIRRAKADVPFPSYRKDLAKREDELFAVYMKEFPAMIYNFNAATMKIAETVESEEEKADAKSFIIAIEPYTEKTVAEYLSILLLILYGRIMKRLGGRNMTKYDAIELDAYFDMYCKLGTDMYLFRDVWTMARDFVKYAIETWPVETRSKRTSK